jgi:hypothetical protein
MKILKIILKKVLWISTQGSESNAMRGMLAV